MQIFLAAPTPEGRPLSGAKFRDQDAQKIQGGRTFGFGGGGTLDPKPGPKRDPRFRLFGPAPHRGNRGDPRIGSILGPDSGSNCDPTFGSKIASRPFPSAQVVRIAIHPAPALTSRKWTPPKPSGPKKDPPGAAQRKINRKSAPGLPRLGTFLTPESCPRMAPISGPHFFQNFGPPTGPGFRSTTRAPGAFASAAESRRPRPGRRCPKSGATP